MPNPYPDILTEEFLKPTREDYVLNGRRFRYVTFFPPGTEPPEKYNLNDDSADAQSSGNSGRVILQDKLTLTGLKDCHVTDKFRDALEGEKRKILSSPQWASFRNNILPVFEKVRITNVVCLGLGGMYSISNEEEMKKTVTELALVLSITDYIREQQINTNSGKIPIIFQDPQFSNADARLFDALKCGARAIRAPHAKRFIDQGTFLFALHLPHDTTWNFAFADADPGVFLGNNINYSSARCMADAYVDFLETKDQSALDEVHKTYNNSRKFLAAYTHRKVDDVVSWSEKKTVFGDNSTSIWFPRRLA